MWVLIFVVISLSGEALLLPPLPFRGHDACRDAGQRLEASIGAGLERHGGGATQWQCVESNGFDV